MLVRLMISWPASSVGRVAVLVFWGSWVPVPPRTHDSHPIYFISIGDSWAMGIMLSAYWQQYRQNTTTFYFSNNFYNTLFSSGLCGKGLIGHVVEKTYCSKYIITLVFPGIPLNKKIFGFSFCYIYPLLGDKSVVRRSSEICWQALVIYLVWNVWQEMSKTANSHVQTWCNFTAIKSDTVIRVLLYAVLYIQK